MDARWGETCRWSTLLPPSWPPFLARLFLGRGQLTHSSQPTKIARSQRRKGGGCGFSRHGQESSWFVLVGGPPSPSCPAGSCSPSNLWPIFICSNLFFSFLSSSSFSSYFHTPLSTPVSPFHPTYISSASESKAQKNHKAKQKHPPPTASRTPHSLQNNSHSLHTSHITQR